MADLPDLDEADAPAVRTDLETALIDDELVIFDPVAVRVHQLDRLGSVIWQFLDGSATVRELIGDLAEGFGVPPTQVRADLATLLGQLRNEGLLDGSTPDDRSRSMEPRERPEYLKDPPAP